MQRQAYWGGGCILKMKCVILMEKVPSFFYWIGSGTPGETAYAWHQSRFKADDAGVRVAAEVMAAACFSYIQK